MESYKVFVSEHAAHVPGHRFLQKLDVTTSFFYVIRFFETALFLKVLFLHNLLLKHLPVVERDPHHIDTRREAADVDAPEA